jgi:hypothetical protein
MAIRVLSSLESEAATQAFVDEISRLSGIPYPPTSAAGWSTILSMAGFSSGHIAAFLSHAGFDGYEGSSELPVGFCSTSGDQGPPTFSLLLLQGLRRNAAMRGGLVVSTQSEQRNQRVFELWQTGSTLKEINCELKQHPEWESFENERAVRAAILSWSKRIGQKPRRGQPGRPPKRTRPAD